MQTATDLDDRITDAFVYAFAVHDLARTRWNATDDPRAPARLAPNALRHQRELADHRFRAITQPNNDTFYTTAWLDLSAGPVVLALPAMGERYWSVAFMDPFTDEVGRASRRIDGGGPVVLWIATPEAAGDPPPGARALRLPATDVWMLARVLVDGAADAPAVHALQDAMRLDAPPVSRPWRHAPDERDPRAFLAFVSEALGRGPVPARDAATLARIAPVGVVPGADDPWTALAEPVRDAWTRLMPELRRRIRPTDPSRRTVVGPNWSSGLDHIGRFGTDHAYRSTIALFGLGALPRDEAIYATCARDADGHALDGANAYALTVPADLPVEGFWSLSMYRLEPDGRAYFVGNPIDRWTIGDRTPGIERDADGSLTVRLQHAPPTDPKGRANWVPAPDGRFLLNWRLYEPGEALVRRTFALPGVRRTG